MKVSKISLWTLSLAVFVFCFFSCGADETADTGTNAVTDTDAVSVADGENNPEGPSSDNGGGDGSIIYSFLDYDPTSTIYGLSESDVIAYYSEGKDDEYTDSSENQYNGTAYGIEYSDGIFGDAAVFNGIDSYATLPSEVLNTEDITLSLWVNWNGGDGEQAVFDFSKSENRRMYLSPCETYGNKGQSLMRFSIGNGDVPSYLKTENPLPEGEWTHICVVIEKDIGRLYINGKLKDTNTKMTVNPSDIDFDDIYVGKNSVSSQKFNGMIDEFLIYKRALTADEVSRLANPASLYYSADNENIPEEISAFVTENGYIGKGLAFDGSGYLIVTKEKLGSSALSFAGHVYCEKQSSDTSVLSLVCDGDDKISLIIDKDGQVKLDSTVDGISVAIKCDTPIEFEKWSHIALTVVGEDVEIFVNGKLAAEGTLTKEFSESNINELRIADKFVGKMDEIVLFGAAVDESVIEALAVPTLLKCPLDGSLTDEVSDNGAVISGTEQYGSGYIAEAKALNIDGKTEIVLPDYMAKCAELTFTFWINAQKADNDSVLFLIENDNGEMSLLLNKDNKLSLMVNSDSANKSEESADAILTGEWVQLAVTVGQNAEVFVNGISEVSVSDISILQNVSENVKIALGSKENGFSGLVSNIGVYANILDAEEICRLQREVIDFPSYDDNLTYLKAGDGKILESYSYWGIPQMHDGEVVKYDGYYYVYSTDCTAKSTGNTTTPNRPGIQMRRSKDLVNWEFYGWATDAVPEEAVAWTGTDNMMWAPSINEINGKWFMYYSVSSLGNRQTYLGVMSSDSPLGPWKDEGEVFKVANGDPNYLVNPIDPNLFFDKNGDPWLVYGSYYGGIYVNKINPETGKFVEYGEGTCIARRTEVIGVDKPNSIEGAFIIYNEEFDEYVLFVSYGSFTSDYSLRIAKSKTPDGEYLDYDGISLTDTKYQMTTPIATPVGTKIMGSYRFNNHHGWVGLGHNGVYEEDGEWYSINNSHFVYDTSYCYMHVRKLLWTEDGWPIVSPEFYAGEKEQTIPEKSIVGEWEFIMFELSYDNLKKSETVKITSNGKIEKNDTASGTWSYIGENQFEFDYNNKKIKGYILPAWDWENWNPCLVYSGLDDNGNAVWGKLVS